MIVKTILFLTAITWASSVPQEAFIFISNYASSDIIKIETIVDDINDWAEGSNPSDMFQGLTIAADTTYRASAYVESSAESNYFTMTLTFRDGSSDTFHANMKYAIGGDDADLEQSAGSHHITVEPPSGVLLRIIVTDA